MPDALFASEHRQWDVNSARDGAMRDNTRPGVNYPRLKARRLRIPWRGLEPGRWRPMWAAAHTAAARKAILPHQGCYVDSLIEPVFLRPSRAFRVICVQDHLRFSSRNSG